MEKGEGIETIRHFAKHFPLYRSLLFRANLLTLRLPKP